MESDSIASNIRHLAFLFLVAPVFVLSLASAAWSGEESESTASMLLVNANILTMDGQLSRQQAMAISGERILSLGTNEEVGALVSEGTVVKDLKGQVVMPAFIDAHVHTMSLLQMAMMEDVGLTRFRSVEEALDYMSVQGMKAKPGDWLLFRNIDFGTQKSDTDMLTAQMLDRVSLLNPVFVLHAGGHISSVNTKMLDLMGVDSKTPDPAAGGNFGRTETGDPDGVLYGFATLSAFDVIEPFKAVDVDSGIGGVSDRFAEVGIGTVGDAGVGAMGDTGELAQLRSLADRDVLRFRVRGYLSFGLAEQWDALKIGPGYGDDRVRIVGYKLSADGSNQARTGLQRDPYPGTESVGIAYMSEEELYAQINDKSRRGFQMAMHGNGDAAIDNIISAVTRVNQEGIEVVRPRIEHCSMVQDDQIPRIKAQGLSCSFLIGHVYLWGAAFKDSVFGLEKAEKLDRAGSFERAGIPYSLHTDNAVTEFSPLEMVEIAVTRKLFAESGFVLAPAERASREMALRAITSSAAWQLMSEHEIGSLEPGKLADFVVLEDNPMTVPDHSIGEIRVQETWVAGERVY